MAPEAHTTIMESREQSNKVAARGARGKEHISAYVTAEVEKRLRVQAAIEDCTRSALVENALRAYFQMEAAQ